MHSHSSWQTRGVCHQLMSRSALPQRGAQSVARSALPHMGGGGCGGGFFPECLAGWLYKQVQACSSSFWQQVSGLITRNGYFLKLSGDPIPSARGGGGEHFYTLIWLPSHSPSPLQSPSPSPSYPPLPFHPSPPLPLPSSSPCPSPPPPCPSPNNLQQ